MIKIAPSILSADFANLASDLKRVAQADWLHLDIMDGHFVPNISFGFPILEVLPKITDKFLDLHLMIEKPDDFIPRFAKIGMDLITIHVEACTHLHRSIQLIKEQGTKAGVALNPATPLCQIEHILPDVDLVLLMTVNPGFGGQPFIPSVLKKIAQLKSMLQEQNLQADIQVDGGINLAIGQQVVAAGANVLVAGSAIFNSAHPGQMIKDMKALA